MKRAQLEHVLRAASQIVDQRDFLVIGSAAILGTYPDEALPLEASRSEEADLAPFDDPTGEKSAAVEGSLGQLSPFHATFGYYADGVDFATAKLVAGRIKDFEFVGALLRAGLIERVTLAERVERLPRARVPAAFLARARAWVHDWDSIRDADL